MRSGKELITFHFGILIYSELPDLKRLVSAEIN